MKIGIFVGSFNPVHIGHIEMVNELINKKYLDKIYIIPTENYWDKNNLIELSHRVNMLKFFETDNIIIDTRYSKIEYTYQILNEFKKEYKNLYLIIGADNLEKFHLWKNVDQILENKILVLNRNNIDCFKYINKFKNKDSFIVVNNIDDLDVSSTKVRKDLKNRSKYLDKRVLDYINKNNLYKGEI